MQQQLNSLQVIRDKVIDRSKLLHFLTKWRFLSQKIVFTNGCFDILHLGHIDYLAKASDEGDILIIGVNTDHSTAKLKGPHRPINNQEQRTTILASLHFVAGVILFDDPTPIELIKLVQPNVLIKGGDYQPKD